MIGTRNELFLYRGHLSFSYRIRKQRKVGRIQYRSTKLLSSNFVQFITSDQKVRIYKKLVINKFELDGTTMKKLIVALESFMQSDMTRCRHRCNFMYLSWFQYICIRFVSQQLKGFYLSVQLFILSKLRSCRHYIAVYAYFVTHVRHRNVYFN